MIRNKECISKNPGCAPGSTVCLRLFAQSQVFRGRLAALTMVQLVVDESDPHVKHLYKPLTLHIGVPWCLDKVHTFMIHILSNTYTINTLSCP